MGIPSIRIRLEKEDSHSMEELLLKLRTQLQCLLSREDLPFLTNSQSNSVKDNDDCVFDFMSTKHAQT